LGSIEPTPSHHTRIIIDMQRGMAARNLPARNNPQVESHIFATFVAADACFAFANAGS